MLVLTSAPYWVPTPGPRCPSADSKKSQLAESYPSGSSTPSAITHMAHKIEFRCGGFRRRRWHCLNGLGQGRFQLAGILRGCISAAGFLGQALELRNSPLIIEAKAHRVNREINAKFFKLFGHRAGIKPAGFNAIGNKNDAGLPLGIFQRLPPPCAPPPSSASCPWD